ncbi:hypothetical protein GDO81_017772 [Engystomops pustulosus]|uniref:NADH dehydrogenase [ubiquinone] 1 alpha subcomplex subunit 11 n=1 Tax=Engystomops pustulosus TaxID=76066 RepID=A0AAV7A619_ENGPU|nr:hypothetical protein GDO81_017772 [Engystomops pustulosus]
MGYWDIPDGTDCVQKTWLATKISVALGLVGSAYHIVAFPPKTVMEGATRAGGATLTMAHSYATGTGACVALGVIAALAKSSNRDGWDFIRSDPKL